MAYNIICLITEHYLDPAARAKVAMLLAADTDTLTGHYIANEATRADKGPRPQYDQDPLRKRHGCGTLSISNLAAACSAIRFYLRASRPPKDRHGLSAPRFRTVSLPSRLRCDSRRG